MISKALDLIWPRRCEVCARAVDRPGRYVCSDCMMRLPFNPLAGCCRCCSRPVEGYGGEFLCENCRREKPFFDRAAGALDFEGEARRMLLDFKFSRHLHLIDDFADWMEAAARARFDVAAIDTVLPVPMPLRRRMLRGYNQCDVLASALAGRLGKPCVKRALARTGSPRRQSELGAEERRENVKGTFAVRKPDAVRGKTVLVVDDVITTGYTVSEAARVLKEAGADAVLAMALAQSYR